MRQNLFLLKELVKRDFQGRYAGSLLGFFWSFIQPLWMLLLFSFVFSTVMKVSPAGTRTGHFGTFLFCGLLPWMALHEGVLRSSTAITDNSSLVKKLRFPSEILVLAVVLAALLHEAIAGALFLAVLVVLREASWSGLPLLLLALPLQVCLTLGLGWLLAAVNVFFRDTSQLIGMLFTGWFYFTPIVYPLALVPERVRGWVALNPLTPLVGLYRQAFLGGGGGGGGAAGAESWAEGTWALAAIAPLLALLGLWVFHRLRPAFVDEI